MINFKSLKVLSLLTLCLITLSACGKGFFKPGDARKVSPDPRERVKKNLEEGKGFRLNDAIKGATKRGGNFEFASSNELWRASLDIIEFMPLTSANYSGGIIITDWYSSENSEESIKLIVRFLTNEIRSDAVDIKVFYKNCSAQLSCKVSQKDGVLKNELRNEILKQATIYQKQRKDKNFKEYNASGNQKVK